MIYYTKTQAKANRMRVAMLAFTGWNPSMFRDGRLWRVQDDSIGHDWEYALCAYLAIGGYAHLATPERVRPYFDNIEAFGTAVGFLQKS